MESLYMAKLENRKTAMTNGGWKYDTHPYLESLDANKTIEIANIKGPAEIKCIYIGKHEINTEIDNRKKYAPRGIVLLIYYNDEEIPAVQVPLADFFCDGLNGKTDHFSNIFFENSPEAYTCYISMPFEKSCRVCLRNDTPFDISDYSYVEYEELDKWDSSLGYFHSAYKTIPFQLNHDTLLNIFNLRNCSGHILGRQLSISTTEPVFAGFAYIMEGNVEIRIDTDNPRHSGPYEKGKGPDYDYLGSECFFGHGWGWRKRFIGNKFGCPYYNTKNVEEIVEQNVKRSKDKEINFSKEYIKVLMGFNNEKDNNLTELSTYRFFYPNLIRFTNSIDFKINWKHEFLIEELLEYREFLKELSNDKNRLLVTFDEVMYWYQDKVGYEHLELSDYEKRI